MTTGVERLSWCVRSLDSHVRDAQADAVTYYAASTLKLAILIAVEAAVNLGELESGQFIDVPRRFPSAVGNGTFVIEDAGSDGRGGASAPVGELLRRMVVESSNDAANALALAVGLPAVRRALGSAGCSSSEMGRLYYDSAAADAGLTLSTSAADLSQLLCAIGTGSALPGRRTGPLLALMTGASNLDGLRGGLPAHVLVAGKTGRAYDVAHECGIVFPHDAAPYALAVCTRGWGDRSTEAIRGVSARAWAGRLS